MSKVVSYPLCAFLFTKFSLKVLLSLNRLNLSITSLLLIYSLNFQHFCIFSNKQSRERRRFLCSLQGLDGLRIRIRESQGEGSFYTLEVIGINVLGNEVVRNFSNLIVKGMLGICEWISKFWGNY